MPEYVEENCKKILELVEELESVSNYKEHFDAEMKQIFEDYQDKKYGYFKYDKLTKQHLKGKTKKEWDVYYSHQMFHILKRIEYLNSQIFYQAYNEKPRIEVAVPEEAYPQAAAEERKAMFPFLKPKKKEMPEMLKAPSPKERAEFKMPILERLAQKEKPEMEELQQAIEEEAKPVPLEKMIEAPLPKKRVKMEWEEREREERARVKEGREIEKAYIVEKPIIREIIRERRVAEASGRAEEEEIIIPGITEGRPEYITKPGRAMPERTREEERIEKPARVVKERRFVQPSAEVREISGEEPKPRFRAERPAAKVREETETKIIAEEKPTPFWKKILPFRGPGKLTTEKGVPGAREFKPELRISKEAKRRTPFYEKPTERITFGSRISGMLGIRKKKTTFDMIVEEEKRLKTGEGKVKLKNPIATMISSLVRRVTLKEAPESKKKRLIEKDMRIRFMRTGTTMDKESLEHISGSLIKKEARRIQQIMTKQKQLKLYNPTLIGTIANVSVRDISYTLVDLFPEFFRQLYNNMRLANIKILSNTYVNMMVFSTIVVSLVSLVVLPTVFFLQGSTLLMALLNALLMSIFAGAITFLAFYSYPIMKIKERRRSIKTNLPFALNHMAAVASSGVPPNVLFKLISSSKEYGEICIESEKINQFVTIFGYDLLSAMKTVAETTPSKEFKDFLDGMVSTIESGGNLQEFLGEKSKEELLNYELDRQKYTETIATYSDIYTGLLIAAPLFFVAALSLISILGGGIGGVSVDVIISVGTYIALPVLNIMFIVFLEVTQPEF